MAGVIDSLAGAFASFLAIFAPAPGAQSPDTTRVTAPGPLRYPTPPVPKPGDRNLMEACQAAEIYVAALTKAGLPRPPMWDSLSCEEKVIAVASIGGPQNAALAAAFVYGQAAAQSVKGSVAQAAHNAYQSVKHYL